MRSYRQYCGLARALDVVGDRWTLLIVRELLIRGAARYVDLLAGLPGVATNLLADRLREMEDADLVVREELAPPAAATVFRLTPRGQELQDVIAAFGHWARPLMGKPRPDEEIRGHWYILPARLYLKDRAPNQPPVSIQLELGREPVILQTTGDGAVTAHPGRLPSVHATLAGEPSLVMGVLGGRLTLRQARAKGLRFTGDAAVLDRVRAPATLRRKAAS